MSVIPIEALATGVGDLGLESNLFLGELPADAPLPCTVMAAAGGEVGGLPPLKQPRVHFTCYARDQHAAWLKAWALYGALHGRDNWLLNGWRVLDSRAEEEPRGLPSLAIKGGKLFRVRVPFRMIMREGG